MRINVAIVDDEQIFRDALQEQIKQWSRDARNIVEIFTFINGDEFLEAWKSEEQYDVVFLDIMLEKSGINGMDVAKAIRQQGSNIPIVFITSVANYMNEGYRVEAIRYLIKPLNYQDFKECMNRVVAKISLNQNSEFLIKSKKSIVRIPYADILYFSSFKHYIEIHLKEKSDYRYLQKFQLLEKNLPPEFVKCHRGIIINIEAIHSFDQKNIVLTNGEKLPVSKSYFNQVKECFILYFG